MREFKIEDLYDITAEIILTHGGIRYKILDIRRMPDSLRVDYLFDGNEDRSIWVNFEGRCNCNPFCRIKLMTIIHNYPERRIVP